MEHMYLHNKQLKETIRIYNARFIPGANGQFTVSFNIDKLLFIQNKETIQKIIGYNMIQSDNNDLKFMDYEIYTGKDYETITECYALGKGMLASYSEGVRDNEDPWFEISFEYIKFNENNTNSQHIHIEECNCEQCREKRTVH